MVGLTLRSSVDVVIYLCLAWASYRRLRFYFFPHSDALSRYQRSPRAWALITGSSGGIGLGYAEELITRGFGVVLVANNKEKLARITDKLRSDHPGAAVETVSLDSRKSNNDDFDKAFAPVMSLPITIVINNVGSVTMRPPYQRLSAHSAQDVDDMINLNARFMAQVSRVMLPNLERNGPSLMVHMSSGAFLGAPWLSSYSAGKAFNIALGAAIARESIADGIKVDSVSIVCGEVHSEANNVGVGPGSPTSRGYAKIVLDRVGTAVDYGMRVVSPYWLHALQWSLSEAVPEPVLQAMFSWGIGKKRDAWLKAQ